MTTSTSNRIHHTAFHKVSALLLTAGLLWAAGCASTPENVPELERARTAVQVASTTPGANAEASRRIEEARRELRVADEALAEGESVDVVVHHAYLAERHAQIAQKQIAESQTRKRIGQAELERTRVQLAAREYSANLAEQRANAAEARANQASGEALRLQAEIEELKAMQTERGLVLTLGDVLFETDQAALKPGADKTITNLTEFMAKYPERRVRVEGHTDARGSDEYNLQLSQRRANAVRDALMSRGVSSDRIMTSGLGEGYPVASNDTSAGMQQNRRVEIVISDEDGNFPPSAIRRPVARR
jgi:outer membrane protein OmpA-like peptidoglycan-associated protein